MDGGERLTNGRPSANNLRLIKRPCDEFPQAPTGCCRVDSQGPRHQALLDG